MKQRIYKLTLLLLLSIFVTQLSAQEKSKNQKIITPILLDKAVLSGVGLDKINLKHEPERTFHQKRLYGGEEISVYVVSSDTWTSPFDAFWFDEFIYIFQGKAKVTSEHGEHHFNSGEYFFAPKGFKGEWGVQAGDHLHYELSVITNKRADSTQISKHKYPQILDKNVLSGNDIIFNKNGHFEKILFEGIELTIKLKAEKPRSTQMDGMEKEKLICLLSGVISLKDNSGKLHQFYAGDYFVLPTGFKGKWESQGHSLAKFITVEKS